MPTEEELNKKEATRIKDLGNASYKARKFDEALEHYSKAWELDSTNISILTNKSAVYFEMGNYDECIKTCEEAIEVGREHRADYKLIAKALGRIGTSYFKQNNFAEAIRYYNKSLAEHRTPDILAKLKEAEKVKDKADKEAYRDPALSAEARERGNVLFKQSDFVGAVKEYSEAIKRDENDPRAYSNRAACYTKLMAINEALKDCETCIKLDPTFVKGYIRKAAIQFLKKEYNECLETCQQAKELDVEKKNTVEIGQQINKVYTEMNRGFQRRDDESEAETVARAQQDPEVQRIMGDPAMRSILQQMQEDPKAAQEHMKNPQVEANIRKLAAAASLLNSSSLQDRKQCQPGLKWPFQAAVLCEACKLNNQLLQKILNIPYATVRRALASSSQSGPLVTSPRLPAYPQPTNDNPLANLTNDPTTATALSSIQYSEEHCLNMNIYTPFEHLNKTQTLIPVMVWIHGGGFLTGSNALPQYDVSINYRLNYLGFMSSQELVQDVHSNQRNGGGLLSSTITVGNWGLLDQRMALEWVRGHIHNFGGNASDVTVFGESAGATSIGYHLLIPEHHGLFQRAIMQSGTATTIAAGRAEIEGQRYFDHLCRHFQLDDHVQKTSSPAEEEGGRQEGHQRRPWIAEEKITRLRAIPATELVKAGDRGRVGMFTPTIDHVLIHADVRGTAHDPSRCDPGLKAVMLGDCRDEGQSFMPTIGARNMKRWDKFMARYCPPTDRDRKDFEAMYGIPKTVKEARRISSQVLTDAVFAYPNQVTSVALMKTNKPSRPPSSPAFGRHEPAHLGSVSWIGVA
ncbi:Hsp90 cochaperone, partial [Modicella reniformis]